MDVSETDGTGMFGVYGSSMDGSRIVGADGSGTDEYGMFGVHGSGTDGSASL